MRRGDMHATSALFNAEMYGRRAAPMAPMRMIASQPQPMPMPLMPQPQAQPEARPLPLMALPEEVPQPEVPQPQMQQLSPLDSNDPLGKLGAPAPSPFTMTQAGGWDILSGQNPDGSPKYLNASKAEKPPQAGFINRPGTNVLIPTINGAVSTGEPLYEANPQTVGDPAWKDTGPPPPKTTAKITPIGADNPKPTIVWQDDANGIKTPYQVHADAKGNAVLRKVDFVDANGDGIDDRQQGGPQPSASAATPSGQTPSGVTFKLKGDTTAMGQVPTENHQSPIIDPKTASLADAVTAYRKSGYADDSALRQHFSQFPSAAVQAYAQQQQQDMAAQEVRRSTQAHEDALSQASEAGRRSRIGILPTMTEGIKNGVGALLGDVQRAAPVVGDLIQKDAVQTSKMVNLSAAADALLGEDRKTKAELEYEQFLAWRAKKKK